MAITITRTAPSSAPASPTASTGTATGDLTSGKTYYYKIAVYTGSTMTQGVPTSEISATADSKGSIDLSWTAVSGATGYHIWRTPTSGDYSLHLTTSGGSSHLDHDYQMMYLNNGKSPYGPHYTTSGTTFTDLGTSSERNSVYTNYYLAWHNMYLIDTGSGEIKVTGGTETTPATMDDVYSDAVANGYTSQFNKVYDNGGRRVFVCKDRFRMDDYFEDNAFELIYYRDLLFWYGTPESHIGEMYGTSDMTYRPTKFTAFSPVGRGVNGTVQFKNSTMYSVEFDRDYGENEDADDGKKPLYSLQMNGNIYLNNTTLKNVKFKNGYYQQISLDELHNWDTVDVMRNNRGLLFYSNFDSDSTFNNVRIYNAQFDTTSYTSSLNIMFKNSKFYNTTNTHRFYHISNHIRTLLDCEFPNGHNMPTSITTAVDDGTNELHLKWSFDVMVVDEQGNAVSGASVKLEDSQGNVTNLTTDANGQITTQELHEAVYSKDISIGDTGSFDKTVTYNPYTLTITKSGYKKYVSQGSITTTVSEIISLSKVKDINNSKNVLFNTQ